MTPGRRHLPHLRLTAAILVAMLAAIAAGFDTDARASAERARRAELQAAFGSLRLVSLPETALPAAHAADPAACAPASTVCAAAASLVGDDALARAIRRGRLESAYGSRLARLLASTLPPPQA